MFESQPENNQANVPEIVEYETTEAAPAASSIANSLPPLAYFLALSLGFGPVGLFWAVFASDILTGIVGYLVFRRGAWKERIV